MKVLVVGAGFSGAVAAERLASSGHDVLVIDKRPHIGGNAYDVKDEHGVLIHTYGPHVFHTNSDSIVEYLSRFTSWHSYTHHCLSSVAGSLYPVPVNGNTIQKLYGHDLDEAGVETFLSSVRLPVEAVRTSEDVVLSTVGPDICDKFFRNYFRKFWGLDIAELDASVAGRILARTNRDDRYFLDTFQAMPADGYTSLFENMLHHPRITVALGTDVAEIVQHYDLTVYTGPIDAYFSYGFGRLPYRSRRFELQHFANTDKLQAAGCIVYPGSEPFLRSTEIKQMTGQVHSGTTISTEYGAADGEPYYPIPRPQNTALYQKYSALASVQKNVLFIGRLAQYRYFNMDQCIASALQKVRGI